MKEINTVESAATTLHTDVSSLESTARGSYPVGRFASIHEDNEIQELNDNLVRTLSIHDVLELRSNADSSNDDLAEVEKIFTNRTGELVLPPDGGYGWVNAFCFTLMQFSSWGANAGGTSVLLAYYIDSEVFEGASRLDYAWITGIVVALGQMLTPLGLILAQTFGLKKSMAVATVLNLLSYMLAAESKKIWHLYLTEGLMPGLFMAPMFAPMGTVIPKWFLKKRGSATGVSLAGTGLGGLVYSFATNALLSRTGNQKWPLRMIGLASSAGAAIAILLVRENPPKFVPPQRASNRWVAMKDSISYMFQKRILRERRFYFVLFWFSCTYFSYLLLVYSFASYATAVGATQTQASNLSAILNASQVVGRPFMGFIADRFVGRINHCLVLGLLATIFILAFWMNANSYGSLIGVAICLGFTIGVGNVMNMVLIADAFGTALFMSSWAYLNSLSSIPLFFVEVIVLKLRDDSLPNPYIHCQIFVGVVFFVSMFGLLPLRETIIKKRFLSEKKEILENMTKENQASYQEQLKFLEAITADTYISYIKRAFYLKKI